MINYWSNTNGSIDFLDKLLHLCNLIALCRPSNVIKAWVVKFMASVESALCMIKANSSKEIHDLLSLAD